MDRRNKQSTQNELKTVESSTKETALTPLVVFLRSFEEIKTDTTTKRLDDNIKTAKHTLPKKPNPTAEQTHTEQPAIDPNIIQCSSKSKSIGMVKRRTSSPMISVTLRKISDPHISHKTKQMRTKQPPPLFGKRVHTKLVEESDDRPGENQSTCLKTPKLSNLEALTIEAENLPVICVDLTAPDPGNF